MAAPTNNLDSLDNLSTSTTSESLGNDLALLKRLLAQSSSPSNDDADIDISELLRHLEVADGIATGVEGRLDSLLDVLEDLLADLEQGSAEIRGSAGIAEDEPRVIVEGAVTPVDDTLEAVDEGVY